MTLLQLKVDDALKSAIDEKSREYGVSASALIRIVLVKAFKPSKKMGNIFNAERDNNGMGLSLDDLIEQL